MKEAANREERLERLEEALDRLLLRSNEDRVPVLVEGEKDEAALRALGVRGPVHRMHAGVGLVVFAESLAREGVREAVLLVDWDTRGGRFARRLREVCQANSVGLDETVRLDLMRATRGEVRTVESLDTYLANLRASAGPATSDPARRRRLEREEANRRRFGTRQGPGGDG